MPFFMLAFSHAEQREAIANALKRLQTSTRMIQSHCAQSKASCAVGALAQLPHVKKQLESLVFNVKHMLADNECSAAFWMGNLKHKTAAGVPVGSQVEPPAAKAKAAKAAPAKRGKKALAREEEEDLDDDDDDAVRCAPPRACALAAFRPLVGLPSSRAPPPSLIRCAYV
jgi:hypothetical protein